MGRFRRNEAWVRHPDRIKEQFMVNRGCRPGRVARRVRKSSMSTGSRRCSDRTGRGLGGRCRPLPRHRMPTADRYNSPEGPRWRFHAQNLAILISSSWTGCRASIAGPNRVGRWRRGCARVGLSIALWMRSAAHNLGVNFGIEAVNFGISAALPCTRGINGLHDRDIL